MFVAQQRVYEQQGARKRPSSRGSVNTRVRSPETLTHYAGCKWTEPPSPSALPPPPTHWTQAVSSPHVIHHAAAPLMQDIETRLKVLLKVQA